MKIKLSNPEFSLTSLDFKETIALLQKEGIYDERNIRRRTALIMDIWRYTSERLKQLWGDTNYCFAEAGKEQVKERFFPTATYKKFADIWWKKLDEDINFSRMAIKQSETTIKKAIELINSIPQEKKISKEEIKNYLIKFLEWNVDATEFCSWISLDYIKKWIDKEIRDRWIKDKESLSKFISDIYHPSEIPMVNIEQRDILKISKLKGEELRDALEEHCQKYRHIIVRNIDDESFDISHYEKNITFLNNENEYVKLERQLSINDQQIRESNRKLEESNLQDALKEKIKFVKWFMYYRTEVSDYHRIINGTYRPIFLRISRIFNFTLTDVANMTLKEIFDGLDKGISSEQRMLITKRAKEGYGYIVVSPPHKSFLVVGDAVDKVYNFFATQLDKTYVKKIKGQCVFGGKVNGIARVIIDKKNASELKENEILVVPMTSPEFFSGIKKCMGLVTNNGGITCHAAIMAREFGKPCIVGTKIATDVIKTGQRIVLDADKGIVRLGDFIN